jgi:hypothetical protein
VIVAVGAPTAKAAPAALPSYDGATWNRFKPWFVAGKEDDGRTRHHQGFSTVL